MTQHVQAAMCVIDASPQGRAIGQALAAYARQVKNVDVERKACEIRLRAERKAGDLLAGMQKATKRDAGKASGAGRGDESLDATTKPLASPLPAISLAAVTARSKSLLLTFASCCARDESFLSMPCSARVGARFTGSRAAPVARR